MTSIFLGNGRRPQVLKMEDDLKYFRNFICLNGRHLNFFVNKIIMQPETFQFETMVVAPLRVTL